MEKAKLCKFCRGLHREAALAKCGECFLCNGACAKIRQLCEEALLEAENLEWESFCVSSSFAREVFAREEELFDGKAAQKCMCIKNEVNRQAARIISGKSGKKIDAKNPDAIFSIDFMRGRGSAAAAPLYVFGHYCKFSREIAQSSWQCGNCKGSGKARGEKCGKCSGSGRNYLAIEDVMREAARKIFGADDASLHASGREDVDVCMGGSGRPFVLEVKNPKRRRGEGEFEEEVGRGGKVGIRGAKIVGKEAVELVCTSHFEKEYDALVELQRDAHDGDVKRIRELFAHGFVRVAQKTPQRVMHRRSDLERRRRVWLLHAQVEGKNIKLRVRTDAGTYVKEFVSSDGGRTAPSIAAVLGCKAACRQLDVIKIHDEFLQTVL